MSRAGRKRKNVTRKAGRVDWRAMAEDPSLLTKWTAARDRYLEMGANPRMASQAGKLYALRHLTARDPQRRRSASSATGPLATCARGSSAPWTGTWAGPMRPGLPSRKSRPA